MPSYVLLEQFTDQGMRNVKDTTKRAAAVRGEIAGKFGVKITDMVWTLGPYDLVVLAEAPNDEAMAACAVSIAKLGNVKVQTLRAFQAAEVDAMLAKL
ncbi:MAG TPA: GYD domain-containing protein [Candidatus Sulfotelmatobacter sp.]|nr:GYD domain-containing protein [Candidatus Sulfotelmatobacter sp.]HWI59008.1 GYD domain-containing protein [Bacillota bacterium]